VNPKRASPFIEALTGITNAMVEHAPSFGQLAPGLFERLQGKLLVAHNARFDYGFLRNEFARLACPTSARAVHGQAVAQLFPEHRPPQPGQPDRTPRLELQRAPPGLGDAEFCGSSCQKIQAESMQPASMPRCRRSWTRRPCLLPFSGLLPNMACQRAAS